MISRQCCNVLSTPDVVARNVMDSPCQQQQIYIYREILGNYCTHLEINGLEAVAQIERLCIGLIQLGAGIEITLQRLNLNEQYVLKGFQFANLFTQIALGFL